VSASNAPGEPLVPLQPQRGPGRPVPVFVTVAVRTSDGPGPGVRRVPPAEAAALVGARHAVYGEKPPRGFPG
jgi:hypothetical protein